MRRLCKSIVAVTLVLSLLVGLLCVGGITASAASSKTLSLNATLLAKVGAQPSGSYTCSCYALAYARTILDGTVHSYSEYNQYGADHYNVNAIWSRAGYWSVSAGSRVAVFQACIDSINANTPILIHVYSQYGQHWVTVVGYQNVTTASAMSESNLLIIDPARGYSGGNPSALTSYTLNGSYTYVRTDYTATTIAPLTTPTISFDKSSYTMGDTITVSWTPSPADSNLSHYWIVVYDPNGNECFGGKIDKSKTSYSFATPGVGTYSVKIFATPFGSSSGEGSLTDTKSIPINAADTTPPTIESYEVYDVDETGYSMRVTVSDNVGVTRVACPTWTEANGQDDLLWKDAVIEGNIAYFRVDVADHNNESGTYMTHIYVYDASGNCKTDWLSANVPAPDTTPPTLSNVTISDLDETGYLITAEIWDDRGIKEVYFPTWTVYNDQDDIAWFKGTVTDSIVTFRVNTHSHNYETGLYITDIYVYDTSGNRAYYHLEVDVPAPDTTPPTIDSLEFYDIDETGYSIKVAFSDNVGVTRVACPTWTEANGQDDLLWKDAVIEGNMAYFRVDVADHNNEIGTYITDVYVYDAKGNRITSNWVWTYVPGLKGDINNDGKVAIYDAMHAFYHVSAQMTLTGDEYEAADIDGDGNVTIRDAMQIFYYISGKLQTL